MPCYLDTIIKIKHVKQNKTKDTKAVSVWAIGLYPVRYEDNEIEVILYVLRRPVERDPDMQAIFRRDEYYSIGGKIIPGHYAGSTRPKCPLKVSLIGTPQEKPSPIGNTDNSIIEMLITDHINQDHEYTIYVVFPHSNPHFEHLKTSIQPQESIIFIVDTPIIQTLPMTASSNIECETSVKCKKSEEADQLINKEFTNVNNYKSDQEELKKPTKKNKSQKNPTQNQTKNKERPVRTTRTKNPHYLATDNDSDKE
ncbi:16068_t:CDS:2 [Cetraspora pellucida]|uniref:16068_t:CDS:1 n=1 Tax=Cetraspora pellucida TaxID=1433469 RepID=A0ACA9P5W4_9GLOM|nr:16068_t:CDS:2 [Cetraspora pellucida]